MELTVLLDNNTLIDRYLLGEPGLCYLIEDDGIRILFDTGYSDAFLKNAQKMGINLLELDHIALSHGHLDHVWGMDALIRLFTEARLEGLKHSEPTIVAHPMIFHTKTYAGLPEVGSLLTIEKLSRIFQTKLSEKPLWLTDNIVFLGEIPRKFGFEKEQLSSSILIEGKSKKDELLDDTALAIKTQRGLVVVTGCSHSGICNIIEYAKKICSEDQIADVIGGFHLLDPGWIKLRGTVEYFRKLHVGEVHACHCTDLRSRIALSNVCNIKEVGSGLKLEYPS